MDSFQEELILLERQADEGGIRLSYRLIAACRDGETVYRIAVHSGKENEQAEAGCELLFAIGLLERIARGGVLPGNLAEIVEDSRYERGIQN